MSDIFDSSYGGSYARDGKPIWYYDPATEPAEVLRWLNGEVSYLKSINMMRHEEIRKNINIYRGSQYSYSNTIFRNDDTNRYRANKITVPLVYDLIQNRVSRLTKYKTAITILPNNDEFSDKIGSEVCKSLNKSIWYRYNFEDKFQTDLIEMTMVCGEAYLWIDWDKTLGPIHPESKNLSGQVKMVKEDGSPLLDDSGNEIIVDSQINIGDVSYELLSPFQLLIQDTIEQDFRKVEYCFRLKFLPTEEAKRLYPDKREYFDDYIDDVLKYNYNVGMKSYSGMTTIYEFVHKKTKFCKDGLRIRFTQKGLVSVEPLNELYDGLPFERLTDVDYPLSQHGHSSVGLISGLNAVYNNLENMIIENQYMCRPKYVYPQGSIDPRMITNDITLIPFKGERGPALIQANPTSPEIFQHQEQVKQQMMALMGDSGISRGDPPPGVTAGVAIQFLAEQEQERFNKMILKHQEFIQKVAKKTLNVCAAHYDESDGRMLRVLGNGNVWKSQFLDVSKVKRSIDYDVVVQNASAMPDTRAFKMSYLFEMNERFPNEVSPKQVLEMLGFAQEDKFFDVGAASVKTAEAEIEQMLNQGVQVEPEEFDDHITHWNVKVGRLRSWGFKHSTPKQLRQILEDNVAGHELLMINKALKNPDYAQQLRTLSGFPCFVSMEDVAIPEQSMPVGETKEVLPVEQVSEKIEGLAINPDLQ